MTEKADLRSRVISEFKSVALPRNLLVEESGDSLYVQKQISGMDWRDWLEDPSGFLEKVEARSGLLHALSPEAKQFYLPIFLLGMLDDPASEWTDHVSSVFFSGNHSRTALSGKMAADSKMLKGIERDGLIEILSIAQLRIIRDVFDFCRRNDPGYDLTLIQNVSDIDDVMTKRAGTD